MGVTRKIIAKGNGTDKPKKGDTVTIEYTGNLYDEDKGSKNDYRGKQYVSATHYPLVISTSLPSIMLINLLRPLGLTHPKAVEPSKPRLALARSSKVHRTYKREEGRLVG